MVFLALVTSHFFADFVLQSGFKEDRKGAYLVRHLIILAGVFLACMLILEAWGQVIGLTTLTILVGAVVSAVAHVGQDYAISQMRKRFRWKISELVWFLGDQGLHLGVLFGVAYIIAGQISVPVVAEWGQRLDLSQAVFGGVLLLSIGTGVSAVLLAHFLAPFKEAVDSEAEGVTVPSAGLWIGICERFLLIMVIAAGSEVFSSVGLVMGVKSIFRFRELDKRASAEYYLLGSLVSICIAVVIGLSLRWLWTPIFSGIPV